MDYSFNLCYQNRKLLERFIQDLTLEQLNTIPEGFNNNVLWNIGHSIATQQLLTYGLSGLVLPMDMKFIGAYKKGTKPDGDATQEDVDVMHKHLFSSLEKLKEDYNSGLFQEFKEYTLSTTGGTLHKIEEAIEFNNFHEGLHLGCCIQLARLVKK